MLEFFVIFSKSGIVLFATVHQSLNQVVNGLVKHVFLEERIGHYQTDQLQIKYLLDNEFELVYVVGYQKSLQLSYVNKFLSDIQLAFRDKFSDFDLRNILNASFRKHAGKLRKILKQEQCNTEFTISESKQLRSLKRQKRLEFCDLIVDEANIVDFIDEFSSTYERCVRSYNHAQPRQESMRTFQDSAKSKKTIGSIRNAAPVVNKKAKKKTSSSVKKGKAARQWDLSGSNPDEFDFSKKSVDTSASMEKNIIAASSNLSPGDAGFSLEITDSESSDDGGEQYSHFGSIWKNISCHKILTQESLKPILESLREHLTTKNVAAEIADDLCKSVGSKLEGQNINTWTNLKKFAHDALQDAILNILNPNRSINILREIQSKEAPPYVIVFCGVNGVGKSTNLAKIANWLMNNKMKVLVVACDTFRAGAVEQLKTHVMALKSIHERVPKQQQSPGLVKIELFERGYGKDSAAIAWDAIKYAKNNQFDVVMVDTAGRMQDNEPLMKELAKLIKNNSPDLTLFVGEALVGNEAVDQLTKFNRSLLDCGCRVEGSSRSAIDGIVLTKFDTIDDQVGAAISMTYVTGQPIVFVGVGQTYRDLKQLDAKAVTKALMRLKTY